MADQPPGSSAAATLQPGNLPPQFAAAAAAAGPGGTTGSYVPSTAQAAQALEQQNAELKKFWREQQAEIEQVGTDPAEFKNHQLPLARIKKIMKSDEDVRMISAEAPVLFARACEMFILELTLRSWSHSEENKRRTLQRNDIAAAITRTDVFDFLVDIVPKDERADDGQRPPSAVAPPVAPSTAAPAQAMAAPQYNFMPGAMPPQGGLPGQLPQGLPGACMPKDLAAYGQYMGGWNPATGLQPPGVMPPACMPLPMFPGGGPGMIDQKPAVAMPGAGPGAAGGGGLQQMPGQPGMGMPVQGGAMPQQQPQHTQPQPAGVPQGMNGGAAQFPPAAVSACEGGQPPPLQGGQQQRPHSPGRPGLQLGDMPQLDAMGHPYPYPPQHAAVLQQQADDYQRQQLTAMQQRQAAGMQQQQPPPLQQQQPQPGSQAASPQPQQPPSAPQPQG